MKKFPLLILVFSVICSFVACERDDDEPEALRRQISRLYVSTSDYDPNAGVNFYNVYVIDPADSSAFPPENVDSISGFRSAAKGGKFIHYTPFNNGLVFQGSQNDALDIDTAVQVMQVSNTGVVSSRAKLATRKFNDTRGLFYTVVNEGNLSEDYLVVLNTDTLFAVNRPSSRGTYTVPNFYMPIDYYGWGLNINERDLFVSTYTSVGKPNSFNGIVVYKNFTSQFITNSDSLLTSNSRIDLRISGAGQVRGISYSKEKDLLVVVDYSGTSPNYQGRVLFFDNFSSNTTSGSITPDRIIVSPELKQPQSIAIDTRVDAKYLYVADVFQKKIYRYFITDNGTVSPNQTIGVFNKTPYSISLDAR